MRKPECGMEGLGPLWSAGNSFQCSVFSKSGVVRTWAALWVQDMALRQAQYVGGAVLLDGGASDELRMLRSIIACLSSISRITFGLHFQLSKIKSVSRYQAPADRRQFF